MWTVASDGHSHAAEGQKSTNLFFSNPGDEGDEGDDVGLSKITHVKSHIRLTVIVGVICIYFWDNSPDQRGLGVLLFPNHFIYKLIQEANRPTTSWLQQF